MTRLFAALLVWMISASAVAQQVTPQFGQDPSGALRQLSVRDPTLSGSGDTSRTPQGVIDTTTHTFVPTGALLTVTSAANYHPQFAPAYIRTQGYSVPGTGGALYAKAASQPSHAFKFSITTVGGTTVWYELATSEYPASVDMLGALGNSNGTTGNGADDTAMINACVATGKLCRLRANATYRITSAIGWGLTTVPVKLEGVRSSVIYCDPAGIGNVPDYTNTYRYTQTSSCIHAQGNNGTEIDGVLLKGFTIDWGGSKHAAPDRCCQAINARYLKNARIEDVEIKNGSAYGIRYAQWLGGWMENNYIHDFSNDSGAEYAAIQGDDDSFTDSTGVVISGNRMINMLMSKVGFENTFSDPLLPDGYQPNGMKLIKGNRLTVTGNVAENTGQPYDLYFDDSVFANNIARNGLAFCFPLKHSVHRNVIANNDGQNCGSAGVALAGDVAPNDASDNLVIGNRITNVAVGNWADVDQGWGPHTIGLTPPATTFEEQFNLAGNDSACLFTGLNSVRNTLIGNSCDPGPNGDYAFRPGAGAGFVNYWLGNYGKAGIGAANAGRYYANGDGEPDSVHDGAEIKGYRPWVDVAATTDVPLSGSNLINVTGAATILDFIYGARGQVYFVKFNGVMVLRCVAVTGTTNGNLICPNGGVNILTAADDVMAVAVEIPKDARAGAGGTGGQYRVLWYRKANGTALVGPACADLTDDTAAGCALVTAADATAQRTALGLGTAALAATGASGHTIPYLDVANTWGTTQTFTVAPVFTNQSTSRTALGLGTAATQNTGTSGTNVPLLDGANTWSAAQTVSNAAGGTLLNLTGSNDTAASTNLVIRHARPTPTNNDDISQLIFQGWDSTSAVTNYATILSTATNVVNLAETAIVKFSTLQAGATAERMRMGAGIMVGPAGTADLGAGTLNAATGVYQNGSGPLATAAFAATGAAGHTIPYLDVANTFSANQTISTAAGGTLLALVATNDTAGGVLVSGQHRRATPTANDDTISIYSQGNDSTLALTNFAYIRGIATSVTDGAESGIWDFATTQAGSALTNRMRVANGVQIGTGALADPGAGNLRTQGGVQVAVVAVASLPTCNAAAEGLMMGVNNANAVTYNSTVAAGGTNHMPVYCNGTNWVLH